MATVPPALCRDAVVVLPGIMGSELVEADSGNVLWGLTDPTWYVKAWTTGSSLKSLAVTEDERSGRVGRIRATRTLRVPAFAPLLRGIEPYTTLLKKVKESVVDPAAMREFPYDWRLAIDHNAAKLATVAEQHLEEWRRHPKGSRDAKLVLVAHSMGGLVARYFTSMRGGAQDVRAIVTLGTPFYGAVKAVVMLSTGRGAPIPMPRRRLRRLARTMPGLHDLLPTYRCVDEGTAARCLEAADIAALGGDRELAQQAFDRRTKLHADTSGVLKVLVGIQQPTMQSVTIADGVAEPLFHTCEDDGRGGLRRVDYRGDSTVYSEAAAPQGMEPTYLPQSHSALAKSEEAIANTCAVMTRKRLGPSLGEGGVGLELPDIIQAGAAFQIVATDVDKPSAVTCDVERIDQNGRARLVARPYFVRPGAQTGLQQPSLVAHATLPLPGLYRVSLKHGAPSAVSQVVLAIEPGESGEGDEHDLDD
jgi:pimeloyl-ACP methyl ester carboxylesterase